MAKVRDYRRTPGGYYASFKYRKYALEFTRQEFINWDLKQPRECFYCGISEEAMLNIPLFYKKRGIGDFYRLTIDRKDNTKFYSLDNIVLACPRCNETKGELFSAKEFKEIALNYIKPKWLKFLSSMEKEKIINTLNGGMPDMGEY